MSSALSLAVGSGFLVGLASSLHCAGMCGTIGSALAIAIHPDGGPGSAARTLLPIQFGRVLAYAAAGGAVGFLGTSVVHLFDQAAVFQALRVTAAATLIWIGLSTAGLLPSPAVFDRWAAPVVAAVLNRARALPGGTPAASVAAGIAWGFMPCAMVYAALFVAMLQGTPGGGAAFMLGFGLATVTPVMAASLGLSAMRQAARGRLRLLIGSVIAGLGALSLSLTPLADILCLTR